MNKEDAQPAVDADEFSLGTEFRFDLASLADNEASYTVAQLIAALETTTILTTLTVLGDPDNEPPPHSNRDIVEPLCWCLANLRLQNEQHPLQKIQFYYDSAGFSDVVRQFLVAMKQFGIFQVDFWQMEFLPVRFLTEFCRDNSNLKVLKLEYTTLTGQFSTVSFPANDRPQNPNGDSATPKLDKLILDYIRFTAPYAATNFVHFVAHMSVSALELGALADVINVEFKMPLVEQLTLYSGCGIAHFQAALDAGMATVKKIIVQLMCERDKTKTKLKSLTRMIQGAVKLNSLTIHNGGCQPRPPLQFFQALEACSSITEVQVNDNDGTRQYIENPKLRQLRRITVRNSELGQFVADPLTFPNSKLLTLMRKLDNFPTGLYMLTRRLPEVFSFAKGNRLFPWLVEPNLTRKLRKRKTISYKE